MPVYGILSPADHAFLKAAGAGAIFGPGSNILAAAREVLGLVGRRKAA